MTLGGTRRVGGLLGVAGCLPPLEVRPSSVAPDPAESRGAPPAEGEGNEGFPPPPDKDLESPSSTRLEALVPSRVLTPPSTLT